MGQDLKEIINTEVIACSKVLPIPQGNSSKQMGWIWQKIAQVIRGAWILAAWNSYMSDALVIGDIYACGASYTYRVIYKLND